MCVARGLLHCSAYTIGLEYEKLVLSVLKKKGFQLMHTGGSGDGGQDFTGYWVLSNKKIPVVGQCKCFARSIGPAGVREFENVLYRKFLANGLGEQSISGFIGVMASSNWFTPSALRTVHSSTIPLVVCQVLPERGRLTRVVFNETAQKTVGMHSMAMIDLIYAFD